MIHTVPNTDRVAVPRTPAVGWLAWLGHAAAPILRYVQHLCGLGNGIPELRMSREWLEEYERQSRKQPDGI